MCSINLLGNNATYKSQYTIYNVYIQDSVYSR